MEETKLRKSAIMKHVRLVKTGGCCAAAKGVISTQVLDAEQNEAGPSYHWCPPSGENLSD